MPLPRKRLNLRKTWKNLESLEKLPSVKLTVHFGVTLSSNFLIMQLIYKEKTSQSFPRISFPDLFSFSINTRHFSNTE